MITEQEQLLIDAGWAKIGTWTYTNGEVTFNTYTCCPSDDWLPWSIGNLKRFIAQNPSKVKKSCAATETSSLTCSSSASLVA